MYEVAGLDELSSDDVKQAVLSRIENGDQPTLEHGTLVQAFNASLPRRPLWRHGPASLGHNT